MSDQEFRDQMIAGVSALRTQNESILQHLTKLNGSVGTLYERTNTLSQEILTHEIQCPIKAKVEQLELSEASRISSLKTSSNWMTALKPLMLMAGSGIIILLLMHAQTLLDKIK